MGGSSIVVENLWYTEVGNKRNVLQNYYSVLRHKEFNLVFLVTVFVFSLNDHWFISDQKLPYQSV